MAEDIKRLNKSRKIIKSKSEYISRITSLRKSKLKALKSIEKNFEKIIGFNRQKMTHLKEKNANSNVKKYLIDNVNKYHQNHNHLKKNIRLGLVAKTFQSHSNKTDQFIYEWNRNRKRNISRYTNENGDYDTRYKENFNKNVAEILKPNEMKDKQDISTPVTNSNSSSLVTNDFVVVPSWRLLTYKANYRLEKTENLNDEIYLKRHQKPENEEKQIKRWDLRRQREQYEREKLLKVNNNSENEENKIDEEDENLVIEIVDDKKVKRCNDKQAKEIVTTKSLNGLNRTNEIVLKRLNAKKSTLLTRNRFASRKVASNGRVSNTKTNVFNVYDFDIDTDSNANIFIHNKSTKSVV